MPIDSNLALSVKPIAIPDVAKQFAESQALGQQRQIHAQQIQENAENLKRLQRSNQEADIDQEGQIKLRGIYQSTGGDPDKTVQGAIAAGVSPKIVQGLQQHFADYQAKIAKTKADELPAIQYRDKQMLGLHDEAIRLAETNPQEFAANYPQLYATALKLDPDTAKHLDPNVLPTVDQLKLSRTGYATHDYYTSLEEQKRKAAEASRQADLFPSQLKVSQSDAAIKGAEAAGMNVSPIDAKQRVDTVIDPKKYPTQNARALAMYNNALTLKDKNAALDRVAGEIGEIEKETNPAIRASRVQQAVDVENAVGPLRTRQQIAADVGKQVAIAKLAPESFANIQDPRARSAAESAYDRDSKEAADKVGAAAQLKDFVQAAQSGNKAAPGLIGIAEVRQLVNRVNRTELEGVSKGAGSAWDRLQGKLGSITAGEPIAPDVLRDTLTISDAIEKGALRTYQMKVDINNKTHGGNVKPIDFTQYASTGNSTPLAGSQGQYKPGDTRVINGRTYTRDEQGKWK